MKKLMILTAVLMLTGSAVGCRCCDWLFRGSLFNPCGSTAGFNDPCCPPMTGCDTCGSPSLEPYSSMPSPQ